MYCYNIVDLINLRLSFTLVINISPMTCNNIVDLINLKAINYTGN